METISRFLLTFLLNSAWQIPLITLIACLCGFLLRQASARLRHLLWVAALIFSFGLPILSGFNLSCSGLAAGQSAGSAGIQPGSIAAPAPLSPADSAGETNPMMPVNEDLAVILSVFYLLFLGYKIIQLCRAWRLTQIIRRSAFSFTTPENISAIAAECRAAFGVEKARILCSTLTASPMTVGAFDPLIILPEQLLTETDRDLLRSAAGHELAHIRRQDYLMNLLYEFIYLFISFHPAAAPVKRRIRETRELCCDELVADKLLEPGVYARSLVRLAGSAIDLSRPTNMAIGINDADILEKRIMSILKRPKISARRRNTLVSLTAVLFCLVFIAAAIFTVRPAIAQQSPKESEQIVKQKTEVENLSRKQHKEIDERQAAEKTDEQPPSAEQLAKQKAEREMMTINQANLAKMAKITMAEAIATARKIQPGTVLESRLIFSREGDANVPYYAISIIFDQGTQRSEKFIMINATNGEAKNPGN